MWWTVLSLSSQYVVRASTYTCSSLALCASSLSLPEHSGHFGLPLTHCLCMCVCVLAEQKPCLAKQHPHDLTSSQPQSALWGWWRNCRRRRRRSGGRSRGRAQWPAGAGDAAGGANPRRADWESAERKVCSFCGHTVTFKLCIPVTHVTYLKSDNSAGFKTT